MLSIGSVVYLKEGSKKIMVLNRGPLVLVDEKTKMFDYSGCIYPVGLVPDEILYFNEDNVDKVLFEGFVDEDEERFLEIYENWKNDNASNVERGSIDKPI